MDFEQQDLPPLPLPLGPAGEFTAEQMLIYGLAVRAWDAEKPIHVLGGDAPD
jgi:hypothetical protein